jgi:hypothetical protein
MFIVERSLSLFHCFHKCTFANEVLNFFRVDKRMSKERSEVEGMDMEDIDMVEDMMVEVEVVERKYEGVVLVRHWIGDGAERHRRTHREWEEFVKSGCS